jgi:hypothetical protein
MTANRHSARNANEITYLTVVGLDLLAGRSVGRSVAPSIADDDATVLLDHVRV